MMLATLEIADFLSMLKRKNLERGGIIFGDSLDQISAKIMRKEKCSKFTGKMIVGGWRGSEFLIGKNEECLMIILPSFETYCIVGCSDFCQ
jgi:hypothetical protein